MPLPATLNSILERKNEYKCRPTFLPERLPEAAGGGHDQHARLGLAAHAGRAEQARERVRAHVEVRTVPRA